MKHSRSVGLCAHPGFIASILSMAAFALASCGDSVSGPQGDSCGSPPYFTVLPVPATDLDLVTVFGGVDGPGHTLPTAHAGMMLARENVALRSPGDLAITTVRRVRYKSSPTRQGEEDYAIYIQVCKELTGWFGHVTSLSSFATGGFDYDDCDTYSTAFETVESCEAKGLDIKVRAGDPLGTGGLSATRGFLAIDFGMLDDRVNNFYAAPQRHPDGSFHAVCPWEQFDDMNKAVLFSKLRDGSRPAKVPSGQPRCGSMEVDVVGTARGVWAESGVSGRVQGDETRYITLANYPYRPQDDLVLSIGPANLGARTSVVPRRTAGRVNRAFEEVTQDGQIYCYGPDDRFGGASWFVQLPSASGLRIELVSHADGASPCDDDPATWRFGAAAVSMVR